MIRGILTVILIAGGGMTGLVLSVNSGHDGNFTHAFYELSVGLFFTALLARFLKKEDKDK